MLDRPGKKPFSTSTCHDTPQQIIERQSIKPNPDSGITNDANLWATETMGNPKYSLELFLRVVTVSLETIRWWMRCRGWKFEERPVRFGD